MLTKEKASCILTKGKACCMLTKEKDCPVAWKGQFTRGDYGVPTIMLEAVASADLWIWHAFFGAAGSNNDINVLEELLVFSFMSMEQNTIWDTI
jgi:hypothetical protein